VSLFARCPGGGTAMAELTRSMDSTMNATAREVLWGKPQPGCSFGQEVSIAP
jgi:hypothetical protein